VFTTNLNLSRLWPAFHKFTTGNTVKLEWKRYCDVELNPLIYRYIIEEIFKKMLRAKVTVISTQENSNKPVYELTFEEMNTINYIGGYIIKQLHSKVIIKKAYVDALLLLQSDLPTGLECAKRTEAVDCGGLIHINKMFYNCLLAVEKICQKELKGDTSKLNDVKHSILDKAQDDVDVRFYRDLTIGMTSTEIGDELLRMAINLYTMVRGNAFAKGFMEQCKQKNKKST